MGDITKKILVLDWAGGSFDMEKIDPKEVRFDNPQKRWETTFQSE